MRTLRESMVKDPQERVDRILRIIANVNKSSILPEWNTEVSEKLTRIKAKQLFHPKLIHP
jgi:hypothetical protein